MLDPPYRPYRGGGGRFEIVCTFNFLLGMREIFHKIQANSNFSVGNRQIQMFFLEMKSLNTLDAF